MFEFVFSIGVGRSKIGVVASRRLTPVLRGG